ncbi:ATP-binding protein [Marinobacterium jannaschii]|uniref:ATP-binding protein n=1 Tax=Marinobacterium jannaschii TaxID=64970 RepID=UPI0006879734|nr:ATP-binding protein [Marinobacterium jannaschii]
MQPLHKLTIPALWLLLVSLLMTVLIQFDLSRLEQNLQDEGRYLADSLNDRTRLNEVLLQNFATLAATGPGDHETLRRFANTMRERYPHLVRLQIQQRVSALALGEFEQQMRRRGYDRFFVKIAQPDTDSSGVSIPPRQFYYPMTFVEPYTAGTRHLLGSDLSLDKRFEKPFSSSNLYRQPAASEPFKLTSDLGYALFQAVYTTDNPAALDADFVISLVVNYDDLLALGPQPSAFTHFSLLNRHGESMLEAGISLREHSLLPVLSVTHHLNHFGQPLQMRLLHPVRFQDLNWPLMLGALLISLAGLKLFTAYRVQKQEASQQRQDAIEELENERQQLEKRVTQRTRELNEQLEENRNLAHRILQIQEKERRHLARELHDELGQSLTAIRTDAQMLKQLYKNENSPVHQSADSIDTIARHIYAVTYDLMRSLRPTAMDDLGLVDAMRECIANLRLEDKGIALNSRFSGALNEMSEEYNITLYRLVQEALTNIQRHSQASQLKLELHRKEVGTADDHLVLLIEDDGCGFDDSLMHNSSTRGSGFGLIGMRERVIALGGCFSLHSRIGYGTRIEIRIPLGQATAAAAEATASPAATAAPLH